MAKTSSMRTPLAKVRGLGSAKSGTEHFWRQRVTAAAAFPLILIFVFVIVGLQGASHAEVVATLGHPIVAIAALAVVIAGVIHMRLGMQVIIEDYLHGEGGRILALVGNSFFSALIGIACVFALLKIAFGA